MKITVSKPEMHVPVVILHLYGILDSTSYQSLVDKAKQQYSAGVRDLILDLSKLTFISSAGLGALHQLALLFKGNNHPEQDETWGDYRWAAYHNRDHEHVPQLQEHVKLFSPSKEVREVLDMIGFSSLFEIFTDLPAALASFPQAAPGIVNNHQ